MPQVVLVALILVVASYVLLVGVASLGFKAVRRQTDPIAPSDGPTVSVLIAPPHTSPNDLLQSILESDYPEDRIEEIIQFRSNSSDDTSHLAESNVRVRFVPLEDPTSEETLPGALLRRGLETARGEVLLGTTAECTAPPKWIRSMTRRCTPHTPLVVGPTLVEHEDLFLPRLEALHGVGAYAFAAGLQHVGLSLPPQAPNVAIHSTASNRPRKNDEAVLTDDPPVFASESEAAVFYAPAASLLEYLGRQARVVRTLTRHASWTSQGVIVGVWFVHAFLLVCCLVAVTLPAWRQPALLALLGKMGADALLSVPAARHFGEGTLTRSLVPSELLLVLSTPITGVLSLSESFSNRFLIGSRNP